jgi:hypothetical protein
MGEKMIRDILGGLACAACLYAMPWFWAYAGQVMP